VAVFGALPFQHTAVHYGPLPDLIEKSHLHDRNPRALGRGADVLLYTLLDLVVDAYFSLLDEMPW
jgi:hypothetical protein